MKRAVLVSILAVVALGLALCNTGCTSYKHVTYHPNGQRESVEIYRNWKDTNPRVESLEDVPKPSEVTVPDGIPFDSVARAASRTSGAQDAESIVAQKGGYYREFASGFREHGTREIASRPAAVHGSNVNGFVARIITGILGSKAISAIETADTNDLKAIQTTEKRKGLESALEADTAQEAIRAESKIRAAEIGAGRP